MKVADFIELFRSHSKDLEEPFLWGNEEIVRYLNDAVQEACERAKLIEDRLTPQVCSITLSPNESTYSLHPSVLEIKRAVYRGRPLDETSVEQLDSQLDNWEALKGRPHAFVFEQASGLQPPKIRLVRIPVEAGVLSLTVYRGALKPLSADIDSARPELPERLHEQLLNWMLHRAYSKQDVDTLDPAKSATAYVQFERDFGPRPDANVQRKLRDRRPPVVRCNW